MSVQSRLEKLFVPIIVEGNKFGSNLKFVKWENSEKPEGDKQFASNIVFLTADFRNKTDVVKFWLVVKCQLQNAKVRQWLKCKEQFHNEVYAYENILPFLNRNNIIEDLYPLYYCSYTSDSRPEDEFIVLQDLRSKGFKLTKAIVFLDFEHCAVTMKQLGRYHALSYNAKQNKTEEFFDKIKNLQECRFKEDMTEENYYLYTIACKRAVQPFLDRNMYVDIINRFLEKIEDANNYLLKLVEPEEPVAVICHGDFCRNNLLFRYDSKGKPIDARLYDIAASRYSSPAIDLSFFIFLNTSYELRQVYWEEFLKIYHDSLVETIPDVVKPSLEDIRREMRKKAVYAFAICSTFLPILVGPDTFNADAVCDLPPKEKCKLFGIAGGQKGTDLISKIFEELIERGFVH